MGKLRDFFASAGLCERTEDLRKKPELVEPLVHLSLRHHEGQDELSSSCPYDERLRIALSEASTYALSRLIEEDVIVCMDDRIDYMQYDFADDIIWSAFYNEGQTKILSLYDNGKSPKETGFFDTKINDHSGDTINKLVKSVLDKNDGITPSLMFGTKIPLNLGEASVSQTYFLWNKDHTFKKILDNNPQMKQPPINVSPPNGKNFNNGGPNPSGPTSRRP